MSKLEGLVVEDFPEQPHKIWNSDPREVYYDYRLYGSINKQKVGYITISLYKSKNPKEVDSFWFVKLKGIWTPRPVCVFQKVYPDFRGKEISGEMLIQVNERVKERYCIALASSTQFISNYFGDYKKRGYVQYPAKRVWEKLEERGLAIRKNYRRKPRWVMI